MQGELGPKGTRGEPGLDAANVSSYRYRFSCIRSFVVVVVVVIVVVVVVVVVNFVCMFACLSICFVTFLCLFVCIFCYFCSV